MTSIESSRGYISYLRTPGVDRDTELGEGEEDAHKLQVRLPSLISISII